MDKHTSQYEPEEAEAFARCATCPSWQVWLKTMEAEKESLIKELRDGTSHRDADQLCKGSLNTLEQQKAIPGRAVKALEKMQAKETQKRK